MDEIIAAECIPGSRQGRQDGAERAGRGPCMSEGGQRAAQCILRFTFLRFYAPARAKKKGRSAFSRRAAPGGGRREWRHPFSLFSFFFAIFAVLKILFFIPVDKYDIISLRSQPRWRMPAARWFAARWGIPLEEYLASIDECIRGAAPVPQWYIVTGVEPGRIVAETGVITNDFHDRKDLAPNVCALYVEPELRRCGIAGLLLEHICEGMAARGVGTLYLITEHTSFYERYGWGHLCMARGDDGEQMRVYIKAARP